jgi:hypothetical protein
MIDHALSPFGERMFAPLFAAFANLGHESGYIGFIGKNWRIYRVGDMDSVASAKRFGTMLSATGAQLSKCMFAIEGFWQTSHGRKSGGNFITVKQSGADEMSKS